MSIVPTEASRAQKLQRERVVKIMQENRRLKHAKATLSEITVQCNDMKKEVAALPAKLENVKTKIETEMDGLMEEKAVNMLKKAGRQSVNTAVRDYAISVFEKAGSGRNKTALITYLKKDPKEFIRYFKDVMIPIMRQDEDKASAGVPMVQVNIYDGPDGGLNIAQSKVIDVGELT